MKTVITLTFVFYTLFVPLLQCCINGNCIDEEPISREAIYEQTPDAENCTQYFTCHSSISFFVLESDLFRIYVSNESKIDLYSSFVSEGIHSDIWKPPKFA